MRILLTGTSGAIGLCLVPLLVAAGHDVAGMTSPQAKAPWLHEPGAERVLCDVFDLDALCEAVNTFGADAVLHKLPTCPTTRHASPNWLLSTPGCVAKEYPTFWPRRTPPALLASSHRASPGASARWRRERRPPGSVAANQAPSGRDWAPGTGEPPIPASLGNSTGSWSGSLWSPFLKA